MATLITLRALIALRESAEGASLYRETGNAPASQLEPLPLATAPTAETVVSALAESID